MRLTTASLPGTGGLLKSVPDDFVVEELPAYPPSGDGTHTFLWIEKRALTTDEAMQRVAAALGADAREGGAAGMKDRQAVTRQWISLPNVDPDRARGLTLDGVRVLEAARHPHKLRTGHLRGNRFVVTLRGTTDGVERARAILDALAQRGLANYFGAQRFGARGDNARLGRAILDGKPGPRSRSQRRLVVSAYQSELFNRYLDRRIADDLLAIAVEGDVLKKTDTGGLFTADAAALADAQARLDAGALAVTGPMFGHKMMSPPPGSPSRAREDALLAEEGLDARAFAKAGALAEGTRRPLTVPVGDAAVRAADEPSAIVLSFVLPPGAYATVLLAEVTKATSNDPSSAGVR
ncbi:MAG TPA: tRNA pseudouridine(13) synthase TruD [Polyangia bacterium]|nr:tRNA pseudouridine(13) synthase TruD [Polyangia bacterium]